MANPFQIPPTPKLLSGGGTFNVNTNQPPQKPPSGLFGPGLETGLAIPLLLLGAFASGTPGLGGFGNLFQTGGELLGEHASYRRGKASSAAKKNILSGITAKNAPATFTQLQAFKPNWDQLSSADQDKYADMFIQSAISEQEEATKKTDKIPSSDYQGGYMAWIAKHPNDQAGADEAGRAAELEKAKGEATLKPEKEPGSAFQADRLDWLKKHPKDEEGATNYARNREIQMHKAEQKPDKPEKPTWIKLHGPSGDILFDPNTGNTKPMPKGLSFDAPAKVKPWTVMDGANLVAKVKKDVLDDAKAGEGMWSHMTGLDSKAIQAEVSKQLMTRYGAGPNGMGPGGTRPPGVPTDPSSVDVPD